MKLIRGLKTAFFAFLSDIKTWNQDLFSVERNENDNVMGANKTTPEKSGTILIHEVHCLYAT